MIYQLKIQLQGVKKPPVWRRILVNSDVTFDNLHQVIQAAMGWSDYHLYEFGYKAYDHRVSIGIPSHEDYDSPRYNSKKTVINRFLNPDNPKMQYVYDFGDDWIHNITLEKTYNEPQIADALPTCIDAKGECPPEDCHGAWGYEELKMLSTSKNLDAEDEERLRWYGMDNHFDPKYVDLQSINLRLKDLRDKARKEQKKDGDKIRKLEERAELLKSLTSNCCSNLFCQEGLNSECEEVINLLKNSDNLDITRGAAEIWASAILIELYGYQYDFNLFAENQISQEKICEFFNVKKTSAMNRVYQIREEMANDYYYDEDFELPNPFEMALFSNLFSNFESSPEVKAIAQEIAEDVKAGKFNSFEELIKAIDTRIENLTDHHP